jgi:hypothetical protein
MKRNKRITIVHTLLPAMLLAMLFLTPQQPAAAQSPTVLRIVPPELTIPDGETGTNEVQVADVPNFYGVEFTIEFNKDCVEVVDSDPNTPGVQIGVGPVFTDHDPGYFVGRNWVYTDTGVIEFQATLLDPAPPFTGSGTLANITWRCKVDGCSSPVTLTMTKLADHPNGNPIDHTVEHGTIACGDDEVRGTILLQGRGDHSGTYVFVTTEEEGILVAELEIPIPGVPYAVTDAQGHFEITLYDPPPPYVLPYKCLQAIQHGYLVGQCCPENGFNGGEDLGTITLPGGDATEDDTINIFDLALIAARYGSNDPTADINGDGVVDIYDLVIAAGNMGKSGPWLEWENCQ